MAKRKAIPQVVRFQVFARDGFRCLYCGADRSQTSLVIDHVIPVRDGGTNDIGNLATACRECNAGKAARAVIEPEPGEVVGRARAKVAARWESDLEEVFVDLGPAESPSEGHLLFDPGGVAEHSQIRHMPNFTARAPLHGGWRGESLAISVFPYREVGGYSHDEQMDIRNAVICGYETDALIILGQPEGFHAVCVNYRYKGSPLGYSIDARLTPSGDLYFPGWYPDENGDFQDTRDGDPYPAGTFRRDDKNYGI